MIFYQRCLIILLKTLIFHIQFQSILALEKICSENWKNIKVDKTQYENGITFTAETPMMSKILCGALAKSRGKNSFCFQDGVCKLFQMLPCNRLYDNSSNGEFVTCYSTTCTLKIKPLIPNEAKLHKYAGCVWPSDVEVGTYEEAIEKCKKDGGQLITFEYFPTEKDFTNFTDQLEYNHGAYVGLMRNSWGSDFKWLTGTTISNSSFLWYTGEPRDYIYETVCGNMYNGKLDDYPCYGNRRAYCHFYIH